jgi:hypothetical protein
METQNVTADSNGRYTALLGATKPDALLAELFTSERAHWVGVQVQGQPEQPRVLLVSAPYALKAADAETVGGLPPSAFVLAAPPTGSATSPLVALPNSAASPADTPTATSVTGAGRAAYIPRWTTVSNIGDSVLFQSGTGARAMVGINTTTPASTLDINGTTTLGGTTTLPATGTSTASAGNHSEPLNLVASAYNSTVSTAVAQTFQLQAEPVGNDTATTGGVLSLLYGSGNAAPAETGMSIGSNGVITFAAGQAFPGTGTITSVAAVTGLTGGGGSGAVSLGLASNACASGSALSALPFTCSPFAILGPNTFTGNQGVTGSVTASGAVQGGVVNATTGFDIGGVAVIPAQASGSNNFSAGFGALPPTTTGTNNTAIGESALSADTTGSANTADGSYALYSNATGYSNTAIGYNAMYSNTSGFNNTAIGLDALRFNTTGYLNIAIGTSALQANTSGSDNTASGFWALSANTSGAINTAQGFYALENNTTGNENTASGSSALLNNSTGSNNIAIGVLAGANVTTNSNNIHIGNQGNPSDSGAVRIGTASAHTSAFIAGIAGVTLPTAGEPLVCIDPPTGQLGTVNCASNGAAAAQPKMIDQQQRQIQAQAQQIADLQQRLSRLESLVASK